MTQCEVLVCHILAFINKSGQAVMHRFGSIQQFDGFRNVIRLVALWRCVYPCTPKVNYGDM